MMAFSRETTTPKGAKNGNKKWLESAEGGREGKEQAIEAKSVPLTRSREEGGGEASVMALHAIQHGMDGRAIDIGGKRKSTCVGFRMFFQSSISGEMGVNDCCSF